MSFVSVDVGIFIKMEENEYRTMTKFLYLKDNTPAKIKAKLEAIRGDSLSLLTENLDS